MWVVLFVSLDGIKNRIKHAGGSTCHGEFQEAFFFVLVEAVFVRADMVRNTHSVPESVRTGNID